MRRSRGCAAKLAALTGMASLGIGATPALARSDAIYVNAQYGYSVSYPADLLRPLPVAPNGDGRHFRSADGRTDLLVWASDNVLGQTPTDLAQEAEQSCAARPASYRVVKPRLVAVSCSTPTAATFYRKTLIRGDLLRSMQITYPAEQRGTWDAEVSRIAGSMRSPP